MSRARRRTAAAAPPLACLAVLALLAIAGAPTIDDAGTGDRARRAVEGVPYRIGAWTGTDIPVPPAAVEMLRPDAVLARRYRDAHGRALDLLLVHCRDTRDMVGHYPPACYPAHGWHPDPPADAPALVVVGGRTVAARLYRFRRIGDFGSEERLTILNAFVLPDGRTTAELAELRTLAGRYEVSVRGVGQVQVVAAGRVDRDEFLRRAEDLLAGAAGFLAMTPQKDSA